MFSRLNAIAGGGDKHPARSANNTSRVQETVVKTVVKKTVPKRTPPAPPKANGKTSTKTSPTPAKSSPVPAKTAPKRTQAAAQEKMTRKRRKPARAVFVSASDDESGDDDWDRNIQRLHSTGLSSPATEDEGIASRPSRKGELLAEGLESEPVSTDKMIHMTDIVAGSGYSDIFGQDTPFGLELPFGTEKYSARKPAKPEELTPLAELDTVLAHVAASFVPKERAAEIKDPLMRDCILRRIRRATKANDRAAFLAAVGEYTDLIRELRSNGSIAERVRGLDDLPTAFVYDFLTAVYARTVSPRAQELRNYEAFSNNVYGELLPPFVTRIFRQTHLQPSGVFVDLGSGVGNCVLQAALEVGSESWGCEVMATASELATHQKAEFDKRAKAWGLRTGDANVVSGDFLKDARIQSALRRADVVLCNNYAFDPALNARLVDMFLDLKDGCKIVSLKSFVPAGHVISEHNRESPLNILAVERLTFPTSSVSWTIAGGDYFISTVDRTRLASG